MGAEVQVRNIMNIPGRGAVLLGYIQSGEVQVGQRTPSILFGDGIPRRLEVTSVERLSSMEGRHRAIGIGFGNPPHPEYFKNRFPAGSLLVLEDRPEKPEKRT